MLISRLEMHFKLFTNTNVRASECIRLFPFNENSLKTNLTLSVFFFVSFFSLLNETKINFMLSLIHFTEFKLDKTLYKKVYLS